VDYKTYFLVCGEETEQLYQAIKQRLIEELKAEIPVPGSDAVITGNLIDTADK
jgi:hypothetical protein